MTQGAHAVGVAGLGVLGGAVARRLLDRGRAVVGFDPDLDAVTASGVALAGSIGDLASRCEVMLLALPDVRALDVVVDELVDVGSDGLVVADLGTLPLAAREVARQRLADAGATYLDTPVSGTAAQAASGTLVFYASGDADALARVAEVFDLLGTTTFDLGRFGNGSRMKYTANLLVAVHGLAAAEAHNLAAVMGLDPQLVQEAVEAGTGTSAIFELRGPRMVSDTYEPPTASVDVLLKDIVLIIEQARGLGAATPLLEAAEGYYRIASDSGMGSADAAAVRRVFDSP